MDRENLHARSEAGGREGHRPDHRELGKSDLEQVAGGSKSDLCVACGKRPKKPGYSMCSICDARYGV
ncbi:MAG: hypothetical protein BAA02_01640 [Paenibacillaceae bacterium ZCTH02-B3]|nr:MAG: hypothetical protein BAA02_01640 [Paenibacillaceae bacterium ZCTH02-B3]